ncbi:DUF2269 family protein [Arthrobacter pigmenti]
MADPQFDLSVTTPWGMSSLILYIIAFALNLFLVIPGMRRSAKALSSGAGDRGSSYPAVAAGSGVASLLLIAVVVLMVWKP